jgi:hypothetical protein
MSDHRDLAQRLEWAVRRRRWSDVQRVADRLREADVGLSPDAPRLPDVPETVRRGPPTVGEQLNIHPRLSRRWRSSPLTTRLRTMTNVPALNEPFPDRLLLWIDAVGGYLICLADRVEIGRAVPEGPSADVAILGDLSRRHAAICRDREGYTIQPHQPIQIDRRPVHVPTTLGDGVTIQLGTVRLRFRRPHSLSATAQVELCSPHRMQPAVDAVLLMSEACVLGPARHGHVVCRRWAHELVLYREQGGLSCRGHGSLVVDGQPCAGRAQLRPRCRVEGEDFSFSLEPA